MTLTHALTRTPIEPLDIIQS